MPAKQSLTHGGRLPVALSPAVQPCGHRLRLEQLLTKRWSPRSLRGASPCAGLSSFPLPDSVCAAHSAQACVPHSTRPTPCHNCPARRGGTVLLLQQERGAYRPMATNQLLGPAGPGGATGTPKLEVPSVRARLSTAPHSSSWQQAPEATRLTRIKWRWPREREVGLTRKLNDCNSPCSQTKKEKPYNNLSRYNVTKLTYS